MAPAGPLLDLEDPPGNDRRPSPAGTTFSRQASNVNHNDINQPRPSVSYDDFVGGQQPSSTASLPGGPGPQTIRQHLPPYLGVGNVPSHSQTSDLNDYQRYSDIDDHQDESIQGAYYDASGEDGGEPSGGAGGRRRNRNSVLSLGGGIVGKAKSIMGMKPEYSEMDVPLTDTGAAQSRVDSGSSLEQGKRPKKISGGKFKFGFGRGKPDPSTLGPRIIHINNPAANAANRYIDNHVSTAKYNIATILPKFLFEQFSKYANLFFLFTAALQQIPNISPTNRYTTIGPLIVVLLVSLGKELVEDYKRKTSDKSLNHSKARLLKGSQFETTRWVNVAVGDIVRVESEEPFPADLVLLASSEPEGLCYIETANLDGETNLKIKQAIPETANLVSPTELSHLSGRLRSEQPNSSLYTYEATLTMLAGGGEKELPLAPDQLLLRGATLRNTPWIHGIVVFTGHETKLMRNATATPIKRTQVERMVNNQVLMLVSILIILSVISSVGDLIVRATAREKLAYLYYTDNNRAKQFFSDIFTYWVLYSNLVPISLFVTIEIVKYYHAFLINSDLDIYYEKTDTPAVCRTSSLVEELGQIEYIFSDKTGTLTCNMMEFKQCSIGGIQYADEVPEDKRVVNRDGVEIGIHDFNRLRENLRTHQSRTAIHHFLALLSTCHTVIPERRDEKPGEIKYQAASPDEGALVEGAVLLGYQFTARRPRSVTITVDGQDLEYELLAVCEFNSTRKRMSTIFRCPDGKIRCYCKGADTVILERLGKDNPMVEPTLQHLEEYATEGLRTLCLAMREIPEQEFKQWYQIFDKASTTVSGNRAEELDKAAEIIEHDFFLLGATAIEDRLQDGVPDTIHTLQEAGIKIWVLTGDRQETAINIGMSCRLISEDMTLLIVNEENLDATRENMEKKLKAITSQSPGHAELETLALVIDGKSLTFALEKGPDKIFLDLAVKCKAVICCRVSPLQKALVVKLVKKNLKAILLAIGDGANDVSMIQAAHVGVGISGVEGLQAARSADVAIGQFRYLRKLLLVHGSWSYQRISKVILFSFYKNITLYMTQFWYSFQNSFSGEVIFESWTLSFYNIFFTVFPPLVMGIFDQFISARLLDRYPQLYQLGQKGVFFKMHSFFSWTANGFYHSLVAYFASQLIWLWDLPQGDGKTAGHWVWGTGLYTAVLATVLGKAALVTHIWTKYTFLAIPGSMVIWLSFIPVYATVAPKIGFSTEYEGVVPRLFTSPIMWLMAVVVPCLCLMRDFAWKYAKRMYRPQTYHHVQEIQKYNIQDYRPRMEQFQKAIRKVRQVQRMRKQRGYAFSQADESQTRVLQAYDTTRERDCAHLSTRLKACNCPKRDNLAKSSKCVGAAGGRNIGLFVSPRADWELQVLVVELVEVLVSEVLIRTKVKGSHVPGTYDTFARTTPAADENDDDETMHRHIAKLGESSKRWHQRTPGLRVLPLASLVIIVIVAFGNVLVWVIAGVVLHYHTSLISTAVLCYTLGLRHALDADHISAIDLMTRRLIVSGRSSAAVGTYFSLGHSTIVIIISIAVAGTASAISSKFSTFSRVGGIIGTSVSASFLLLLAAINAYIGYKLYRQLQKLIAANADDDKEFEINGAACLFVLFKKMFKLIDRAWKMYPLGVMFGLGFDTSSEVALLGIASIQGSRGTSIWLILIFPLLFTAGMCLLDTIDGAMMLALYTSTSLASDKIAILYYSIVLTIITVIIAVVIGVIQFFSLILNAAEPTGKFWDGVAVASDHYDIIGGSICASFIVFGGLSVLLYKPWRRHIDRKRQSRQLEEQDNDDAAAADLEGAVGVTSATASQHSHNDNNNDGDDSDVILPHDSPGKGKGRGTYKEVEVEGEETKL